jgi:glycopeptide antibiotics resistance protein
MYKKRVLFSVIFVILLVFYYSWIPDSRFQNETYLPKWLLNWSNHYYNLRTAIPFVAIGFLLETYRQQISLIEINQNKKKYFIQNIGFATIIVCIAEGGQFLIHERNPDIMDVFFGILGSWIGGLGYYFLINIILNFKRFRNAK